MHIFNYLYQHIGDNIQIHTTGCDLCIHDARKMANVLASTWDKRNKPAIIFNTCSVFAEREVENKLLLKLLHELHPNHEMFVMGCDINNNPLEYRDYENTYNIQDINDIIYYDFPFEIEDKVETEEPLIYVKVQDGCKHKCAYCIINKLRPDSFSIPYSSVVKLIREQIKGKENPRVELSGTELTEYYDEETGYTLIDLLEHLYEDMPEVSKFSLTSIDPAPSMTEFVIQFVGEHKDKFVPHITLAVQSASDKVLKRMNRRHDYNRIRTLHELADEYDISLGWDIIVGFPGETEEDFQETYKAVKRFRPLSHTIFAYSPREGTPAYKFKDQVSDEEKQRRLKLMEDLMTENIAVKRNNNFWAFAEYSEELTRYDQLVYIKDKLVHLIQEGTIKEVNVNLNRVKNIAKAIKEADEYTVFYVDFNPKKALECEIYINFFKEYIPSVPVIVTFPIDYEEDLKQFEKVYHCVVRRDV